MTNREQEALLREALEASSERYAEVAMANLGYFEELLLQRGATLEELEAELTHHADTLARDRRVKLQQLREELAAWLARGCQELH